MTTTQFTPAEHVFLNWFYHLLPRDQSEPDNRSET